MTLPQIALLLALANLAIGFFGPAWPQLAIGMTTLLVLTFDDDLRSASHARPN